MTVVAQHIKEDGTVVEFTTFAAYDAWLKANTPQPTQEDIDIEKAIEKKKAKITFGLSLIDWYDGFMDSKGFDAQSRPARKAIKVILKPIYSELADGNLKDAIDEIKLLTNAQFDGVFIRKSAMLKLRNKIEEFRGRPLAATYNE